MTKDFVVAGNLVKILIKIEYIAQTLGNSCFDETIISMKSDHVGQMLNCISAKSSEAKKCKVSQLLFCKQTWADFE